MLFVFLFFFFKQKTAYDMRISDWSSDVCSSDLTDSGDAPSCARAQGVFAQQLAAGGRFMIVDRLGRVLCGSNLGEGLAIAAPAVAGPISTRIIPDRGLVMSMAGTSGTTTASAFFPTGMSSEERRVGKECVSTC